MIQYSPQEDPVYIARTTLIPQENFRLAEASEKHLGCLSPAKRWAENFTWSQDCKDAFMSCCSVKYICELHVSFHFPLNFQVKKKFYNNYLNSSVKLLS